MSKHLTGSKRLAVIHKWLNGRDDPDWEVLPTKKKDKYIVKPRKTPIRQDSQENSESENIEETQENSNSDDFEETPRKSLSSKAARKPPKPRKPQQTYDPTVNEEILKQLKSLGEEMKISREKKEQRRMIKEVVDKRMSQPRQQYVPEEPQQQYEEPPQQYIPPQRIMGRRNRIFEDMM